MKHAELLIIDQNSSGLTSLTMYLNIFCVMILLTYVARAHTESF